MTSSRTVPVMLGITETGAPVDIDLARDSAHIAIQGQTRSGKSVCNYHLLGTVAQLPWVRVVGFDLSGLLLAPFAERGEEQIAIGGNALPRIPEVLDWTNNLVEHRTHELRLHRIDKLVDFSEENPLIIFAADEFDATLEAAADEDAASTLKAADRIEPRIRRGVRRLAALSAKAGVRLILTTQRAEANVLGGASRSNFGTRLTFRVDNPDSVRMLHPSADAALCEKIERFAPGVALLDRPGHERTIIRGPETTYSAYDSLVARGQS